MSRQAWWAYYIAAALVGFAIGSAIHVASKSSRCQESTQVKAP